MVTTVPITKDLVSPVATLCTATNAGHASLLGCCLVCALHVELCTPQLTALLDSKSCEAVLQRAVARNDRHALRLLCRCNVAQAMDVAAVERLISAAVHMGATSSAEGVNAHALIKHLSMLPGMCLTR